MSRIFYFKQFLNGKVDYKKTKERKINIGLISSQLLYLAALEGCHWCTVERLPSRGGAKTSFLLIKYLSNRYFATIAIYKVFFSL